MGQKLLCRNCKKGTLVWVNPESDDLLNSDLKCKYCEYIYHGMQSLIDFHSPSVDMRKCQECTLFHSYEDNQGRNKDNCVTWLCNNGRCPCDKTTEQVTK